MESEDTAWRALGEMGAESLSTGHSLQVGTRSNAQAMRILMKVHHLVGRLLSNHKAA